MQGTVLDRIDFNIEEASHNVSKGKESLKKVINLNKVGSRASEEPFCLPLYYWNDPNSTDTSRGAHHKVRQEARLILLENIFNIKRGGM